MQFPTFRELFNIGRTEILTTPNTKLTAAVIDREGSTVNVTVASQAAMGDEVVRQASQAFRALFLDTAVGQDLDTLAFDRFDALRKPAAPTLGAVTIARPAPGGGGTIPEGLRIRSADGKVTVEIATATAFAGGDLSKNISVRGLTAGSGQDAAAGTLTSFVDAPFDPTFTVTNAEGTTGSGEAETDEQFRDRLRLFFTAAQRGTLAALRLGALSVVGVAKATAVEITDLQGKPARMAEIFVVDENGNVNTTLANAVKAALDGYRAAGIIVLVPTTTAQFVNVDLILSFRAGVDTVGAAVAVQNAVVSLVNNLNPGETLTVAAITAAAMGIGGVVNCVVVQPVGDLVPEVGQAVRIQPNNVTIE